ncbi:hypothetical protein G6F57_019342 [Rhizopus arrhizus]|nr:hypothetical protein G6F57_019342 [Rhizopus arrhizus]
MGLLETLGRAPRAAAMDSVCGLSGRGDRPAGGRRASGRLRRASRLARACDRGGRVFGADTGHGHPHRPGPPGTAAADRPQHGGQLRVDDPGGVAAPGRPAAHCRHGRLAGGTGHVVGLSAFEWN